MFCCALQISVVVVLPLILDVAVHMNVIMIGGSTHLIIQTAKAMIMAPHSSKRYTVRFVVPQKIATPTLDRPLRLYSIRLLHIIIRLNSFRQNAFSTTEEK